MGRKLVVASFRQRKASNLVLLIMLLFMTPAFGQSGLYAQVKASGTVIDEAGDPVIGCLIKIKGASEGAVTNVDGQFTLTTPKSAVLVFSMVGLKTVESPARPDMKVVMKDDNVQLDDVVVVGYATQKKASLTGAISSINNEEILTTKTPSLAVALTGKVPGLRIRQNNGMPGSFDTKIDIRGMGTPMIVIDGVVRSETTEFQKLNPEDVESITVLKDASAAIYGINSSNGAIIVTTKSGKKGPLKFFLNTTWGFSKPTTHTEMMNASQYWDIRNENEVNSGRSPYFSSREELLKAQALPNVNWYDEVFKSSAFQQSYNFGIEGGGEKISSYTNIGYMTDNGLLRSGAVGYHKYSLRNGTQYEVNDHLKVNLNISGYTDFREQPGTWDDAFFYLNKAAHGIIPSETVYANNNPLYFNRPRPLNDNPVQFSQRDQVGYGEWRDQFFQGTLAITYEIPKVKGLSLKAQASFDTKTTVRTRVQKKATGYLYSASDDKYEPFTMFNDPSIQEENWMTQRFNFQGSVNYKRTFAEAHNVSAVAVFETRQDNSRYVGAKRYYDGDFYTTDNIDRAPENKMVGSGNTGETSFVSVVGRFNYDYKSKYLVEFAFREDGSYRYHPDQRWGFFPVASAAWRLSEESFVADNLPFITNLKIRGSWGRSGQDAGNPFQYISAYSAYNGYVLGNGSYTNGYSSSGLVNRDLTWVTTEMVDLGLDVSLWNGLLDYSVDIYKRDRDGLLGRRLQALPNTFGATLPQENLNSDRTMGFEMSIGHRNRVGEFSYGITANMNFSRSETTYEERAPFRSSWDKWKHGSTDRYHGIGWGYQVDGRYTNYDQIRNSNFMETGAHGNTKTLPGDYMHLDVNGDGLISDRDMLPIFWTGDPKMTFGISMDAEWRGLDLNMLWAGASKYTAKYNEILGNVLALDGSNSPSMYYDRWHLEDVYNPDSKWIPGRYPATRKEDSDNGANRLESDVQRINASYIRLKNIEVGYTIPAKYLKRFGLSKARVYANLTNPFVICNKNLKEFDPEISDGNGFAYPLQKSYNFGLNINF